MSEIKNLREQLERWKSHNEVHAKPADEKLYELLCAVLDLITGDYEQPELCENPEPPVTEPAPSGAETSDPPGGNNPEAPDVP